MTCPHGNDHETCSWCFVDSRTESGKALERMRRERLAAERAEGEEILRVQRWHDTYNAAIGGYAANPNTFIALKGETENGIAETFHYSASSHADKAHGPLVKP